MTNKKVDLCNHPKDKIILLYHNTVKCKSCNKIMLYDEYRPYHIEELLHKAEKRIIEIEQQNKDLIENIKAETEDVLKECRSSINCGHTIARVEMLRDRVIEKLKGGL